MSLIADIHNDMEDGAIRLITEYRARLFSDAVRLCGNSHDADDLVDRTFVKVLKNLDQHRPDKNLYGWMKAILTNLHRDDLDHPVARGTVAVEQGKLEEYAGADWSTDEQILKNSDSEALRKALAGLDPKYHQALLLRYYQGFSVKQIAAILQLPLGTVCRRLQIAHGILAGKLKSEFGRAKKPLAVLGALLLGVATLFGAWQGGLLGDVEEQKDEPSASARLQENDVQPKQQPNGGTNEMKLTSTLKSVAAAALTTVALASDGVTIDVTKAQQRYPWNGLVDIDYTITRDQGESALDPAKHSVRISVVNCETAVTNVAHVFRQGALPVSDGTHRVTWDANAEGVNFKSQDVTVFAEVVHYAEKYMIIDVHEGPDAKVYPVTYLHGAPEGGFTTEEYKGNKIALRLIPPGSFVMGSPTTEPGRTATAAREVQHAVAITKPFYIGVFQITQKQYKNVMNADPSEVKGDYHPVEKVPYNDIRGTANTGTRLYDWPWTNEVAATSFMGKLRTKCKEWDAEQNDWVKDVNGLFDLPTDAQWEYACRAGTTTPFNNDKPCATEGDLDTQLQKLGAYKSNKNQHVEVGTYASNAWGLYDMHGNVWEWCLDWYQEDVQNIGNPSVDPVGAASGSSRVRRGGSWSGAVGDCRSACRNGSAPSGVRADFGFRLSRTLP